MKLIEDYEKYFKNTNICLSTRYWKDRSFDCLVWNNIQQTVEMVPYNKSFFSYILLVKLKGIEKNWIADNRMDI